MTQVYQNGPYTFRYTDHEMRISSNVVSGMCDMLAAWQRAFVPEPTFAYEQYGVPSLMVRFDGVLSSDGSTFHTYEIQDGPGGMGYCGLVSQDFKRMRDFMIRERWGPLAFLRSGPMRYHDDRLWLPLTKWRYVLNRGSLAVVRSRLPIDPTARRTVIARSVIPVDTHNNKAYGLKLGLWTKVSQESARVATLPWHECFVLKPFRGSSARNVHIWGVKGGSSRAQIAQALAQYPTMLLQPYFPPMILDIQGQAYHAIIRAYFGYDPVRKAWVPMHGLWTGRPAPNQRVHGASDAIHGPLLMEANPGA